MYFIGDCSTGLLTTLAALVVVVGITGFGTTNCAPTFSDSHDKSLNEALILFVNNFKSCKHCNLANRLSEIGSDLRLNPAISLEGMDKAKLVKQNPEMAHTASLLLFEDRKLVVQLAHVLFKMVISSCKPEVRAFERSLRMKLEEWKWPSDLRMMIQIFETYEKDCLHGTGLGEDEDED